MEIKDFPQFTVETIRYDDKQNVIVGKVNKWKWVGENHIACMLLDDHVLIAGRFRNVNEKTLSAEFIPETSLGKDTISSNKTYFYTDGYWGGRVHLVLDDSLQWNMLIFKLRDAIGYYNNGPVKTIKDGWDHEHCDICWATIDLHQNTNYMQSNKDDKICSECFGKYIKQKSIDFVN